MMSAVNPLPAPDASADKRPYEPSMEEILASIRRIIADDQSLPGRSVAREPEQITAPSPSRDVRRPIPPVDPVTIPVAVPPDPVARRELDPQPAAVEAPALGAVQPRRDLATAHGPIAAPQFAMPHGPVSEEPVREPEPAADLPAPEPAPAQDQHSVATPASAQHAAEVEDEEPVRDPPIEPDPQPSPERPQLFSAATDTAVSAAFNMLAASRLADNSDELMTLAREMIRPLLRSWIDDHLPSMVERMVRAEIERVARGGR